MKEAVLVFPHQLFDNHPAVARGRDIVLIEDPLFFGDDRYPMRFHKMKLAFHRASMQIFKTENEDQNYRVFYFDYLTLQLNPTKLFDWLAENEYSRVHFCEPDDFILQKRVAEGLARHTISHTSYENPGFLNKRTDILEYFQNRTSYLQHHFYVAQRKKFNVLMEKGKPLHGKWSFDADNRKSLPASFSSPALPPASGQGSIVAEAVRYVQLNFSENPGSCEPFYLPVSAADSRKWFEQFLEQRFESFGRYQDAIHRDDSFLMHAVISPMLNVGLITPDYILTRSLQFITEQKIPINSSEGFIRQVLGWREFIRGIYAVAGVRQRNANFWNHQQQMPAAFYSGTTGIEPIDSTIKKLLSTGYNHHIERLMVLGNFMLLCEIHPDAVYKWFMEMYIDAYDWVMVPNVYGMSQFADGGLMSTKPYLSSSNYIRKMSNFGEGEWTKTWDALFWSFISKHEAYFATNRRTVFLHRNMARMPVDKLMKHLEVAEAFKARIF